MNANMWGGVAHNLYCNMQTLPLTQFCCFVTAVETGSGWGGEELGSEGVLVTGLSSGTSKCKCGSFCILNYWSKSFTFIHPCRAWTVLWGSSNASQLDSAVYVLFSSLIPNLCHFIVSPPPNSSKQLAKTQNLAAHLCGTQKHLDVPKPIGPCCRFSESNICIRKRRPR